VKVPEVARVEDGVPVAEWSGELEIGDGTVACYVLNDGRRVISRTGATCVLAGQRGRQLEKYVATGAMLNMRRQIWQSR